MKNFCQFAVPRLGNTASYIISGETWQQSAQGYKFHAGIVNIDNNTAAVTVIAMNKGIEQSFTQSFFGIVRTLDSFQSFECGGGAVAESQIGETFVQLFKNGTAEFFCIFKGGIILIPKYSYFCSMLALI